MEELWVNVIGYEGFYKVSNKGRVKSLPRNGTVNVEVILRPSGKLYDSVLLQKNGVKKLMLVHRIVAINFLPIDNDRVFVNHKDGNKRNNNLSNLEWCTKSENEKHAHLKGLKNFKGDNAPYKKINSRIANEIRLTINKTQKEIASIYNIDQSLVSLIKNNKIW